MFKRVYANHKMCLQKVNVMRKIKVLCIKSLSNYRPTLMLKLIYLQSLNDNKSLHNTKHVIVFHNKKKK